jgi:protein gp37
MSGEEHDMAETTGIEWTDSTFNPWWGCTKISPACDHCYAADLDKRTGGNHWGNVPRRRTSEKNWNEPRRWQKKAAEFMAAHGRRRRVFCASMADVFDNQVDSAWRDDLWALFRECPDLDWLLLTKRPQNIAKMKPAFWDEIKSSIWLGTTIEDQQRADQNLSHLLLHDSAVRFISCEPMVGPINLNSVKWDTADGAVRRFNALTHTLASTAYWVGEPVPVPTRPRHFLNWVIAGGESGPRARVADPEWFRSLRDQCAVFDVPFLFKQWGNWDENMRHVRDKKLAGRLLDGVTHDGYPRAA